MILRHPLDSIPLERRSAVFVPLIVATLAVSLVLGLIDQPLQTEAAPQRIVSFELARTVEQANRIIFTDR